MEHSLSNEAKRIAILGTIPEMTAPNPLYRPSGVSRAAICRPVAKKPRGLSYRVSCVGPVEARGKELTPLSLRERESCMRTLMVSRG